MQNGSAAMQLTENFPSPPYIASIVDRGQVAMTETGQHMNITSPGLAPASETARRNLATLVIALAAIALFVVIGSDVVPKALDNIARSGVAPHPVLVTTLLLNIALVMIGWSRYRSLEGELEKRRSWRSRGSNSR